MIFTVTKQPTRVINLLLVLVLTEIISKTVPKHSTGRR